MSGACHKATVFIIQVLKESLRLYPTAGIGFTKEAPEDCTLSGYHIPQGTTLWVSVLKTSTITITLLISL